MPAFKNMLAIGTLGLGLFQLAAAVPSAKLHIDQTCGDIESNGLQNYVLYTNPQNTDKCITIGAPGFPFFDDGAGVVQCGDYTEGGFKYTDCNNWPRNAKAVQLSGGSFRCTFYSTPDCTVQDGEPSFGELTTDASTECQDFPITLPINLNKQSASSLACYPL